MLCFPPACAARQILDALLRWWFILSLLGWLGWPLAFGLFGHLRGRGYAYSRALGLLLLTYVYWLLGVIGLLPNTAGALRLVAACLASLGTVSWLVRRRQLMACLKSEWRHVLTVELLFAAMLALYAAHKAYDPAINHTEEPMDFAMLNGILRSVRMPPQDPWLSGHTISYYYLGYLLVAVMARLASVAPGIAYNLGLAQTLALTAVGAYGAIYGLAQIGLRPTGERRSLGWLSAGGAVIIALGSNLEGPLELLRSLGLGSDRFYAWFRVPGLAETTAAGAVLPEGRWWWWRASRIISDQSYLGKTPTVITEFPGFSFVLGDLHPHVMALPYAVLAIALASELYSRGRVGRSTGWRRLAWWLVAAWALGALGFLNSWDLPTYLVLAMLTYALGTWRLLRSQRAWLGQSLLGCGILMVLSLLPYLPFYAALQSQAQGIGLVYYSKTPLRHYGLVLGVWLLPILSDLWGEVRPRITMRRFLVIWGAIATLPWVVTALLGGAGRLLLGLGSLAVGGPWLLMLQSASLTALLVVIWPQDRAPDPESPAGQLPRADSPETVSHLLALVGIGLTYGTEFLYVQDLFGTRTNTVFKVYYQAWVLLGIGAVLATKRLWHRGGWRRAVACLSLTLFLAALYYPAAAAYTRADGYTGARALDGTAHLLDSSTGEAAAVRWLNEHALGGEVVIAAYGDEFDASTSRLSAWTGVPTVLGWPGHEEQWRGDDQEVLKRMQDIDAIYGTEEEQELLRLAKKYSATHLYVGPHERTKYGLDESTLRWYGSFLEACFAQEDATLFCFPRT